MSKWVDVSSSFDEEEEEHKEDSKSQIEEDNDDDDADEQNDHKANGSDSDSEAEIYKATKTDSAVESKKEKEFESYRPTESEMIDFINQLNIIRDVSDEVNEKIVSMTHNIDADKYEVKYGLSFFDAKENMLIMYLEKLLAYFQLKLNSEESIDNNPLVKSLIQTKAIIEKSKIIDIKLKPQIDRLLSLAANKREDEANYKSHILDEEENNNKEEEGNEEVDDDEDEDKAKQKAKMKYEVKKNMIEFFETKNEKKVRKRQIEKDREKIRHSEVIQSLRDEITDNPKTIDYSNSHYDKFMKEVEQHEDQTFQRMTIAKNKLKQLKKRDRKEEDLRYFDKDLKQMTNVLINDNEEVQEEKERKTKFLQRKREMKKMENQMVNSRPKPNKKSNKFKKKH